MPEAEINAPLSAFDREFDTSFEDLANQSRGAFLRAFPISKLKSLALDDYVIGKGLPSFCAYVEPKTRVWANILGATSFKFGIYFGRTKSDSMRKYRFTKKFGSTTGEAFAAVKRTLIELVNAGRQLAFETIDDNPLSQMFKAKILSLYFPDKFLNVCSAEHIRRRLRLRCRTLMMVTSVSVCASTSGGGWHKHVR